MTNDQLVKALQKATHAIRKAACGDTPEEYLWDAFHEALNALQWANYDALHKRLRQEAALKRRANQQRATERTP